MTLETLQSLVALLPSYGDRPAVGLRQDLGLRWWSYRRLYDEACRVAASLQGQGLQPGQRILLWAPNCPEWVGVLLGAALRGLVVVPVDEGASPGQVRRLAEAAGAVLLVHGPGQRSAEIGLPTLSIVADGPAVDGRSARLLATPLRPEDPALILFTSGTTSEPRGVILTHRNVISQVLHFRRWRWLLRLVPVRILVLAPLSHSQGLLLGACVPLSIGLSVIFTQAIDPIHLIRTIKDNRVTVLSTVPRALHLLGRALQQMPTGRGRATLADLLGATRYGWLRRDRLFRRLNRVLGPQFWVILVGGAVLPKADEGFWRESGRFIVQGYGLTETAAIVSVNAPWLGRFGSIGRPLSHQDVRIAEDGELLVRGPNVTPGYLGDPRSAVQSFADGFLRTGDLARRDGRDRLYFLGRKKELIVTGEGFNVHPGQVEGVLAQLPGVHDAVVLGLERDGHEEVHAVLLLRTAGEAAAIVGRANAQLEPHQRIRGWTVWPESDFPRASLLKVKRDEVAAAVRLRREPPEPADAAAPTLAAIEATPDRQARLRLLARYLTLQPPRCVDSRPLELTRDLGLSSLDVVELLTLLEQERPVALDRAVVPAGATLADLYRLVGGEQPADRGRAAEIRPPAWMDHPLVDGPRTLLQALVIPRWFRRCGRLTVSGVERLAGLRPPFIVAAAHHEHGIDVMAIYCALPRRLRRRLMFVGSSWVFREYFDPPPSTPGRQRLLVAGAFYVGLPLLFPFAVVPRSGATRAGLLATCRLVDRGFSPIIFPEGDPTGEAGKGIHPGTALIAAQTQVPIVPLRLEGNETIDFHPRRPPVAIGVQIGAPIVPRPDRTAEQITQLLCEALQALT